MAVYFSPIFLFMMSLTLSSTLVDRFGQEKEVWLVKSSSSLKVDGTTNVNHFSCLIDSYGRSDTLVCVRAGNTTDLMHVVSRIAIPVTRFDCGLKMMTKDLQKTLKHEQYPFMYIDFRQFSHSLAAGNTHLLVSGSADIYLAGVSKKYQIQCTSKHLGPGQVELKGSKQIRLTEFNLKPPSKLGGTIKVEDQMEVEFTLHLKKINGVKYE